MVTVRAIVMMVSLPVSLVRSLIRRIVPHFAELLLGFQTIVELDSSTTREELETYIRSGNGRFGWPVAIQLALSLDAIYQFFSTGKFVNYYFLIITRLWPGNDEQHNFIGLAVHTVIPYLYICLLFQTWPHLSTILCFRSEDYQRRRVIHNERPLPEELCSSLIGYFYRVRKVFNLINSLIAISFFATFTVLFSLAELWFPVADSWSLKYCIFFAINPINAAYVAVLPIFANCFLLDLQYIKITQKYHIRRLESVRNFQFFRNDFKDILSVLMDIRKLDQFFINLITGIIGAIVYVLVYFTFITVTAGKFQELILLAPLLLALFGYFLYVYVISHSSSKIYEFNTILHKHVRAFHMRILSSSSTYGIVRLRNARRAAIEITFEHYFLSSGFRLVNGMQINNRMLELCASFLLFMSLKLFGRTLVERA